VQAVDQRAATFDTLFAWSWASLTIAGTYGKHNRVSCRAQEPEVSVPISNARSGPAQVPSSRAAVAPARLSRGLPSRYIRRHAAHSWRCRPHQQWAAAGLSQLERNRGNIAAGRRVGGSAAICHSAGTAAASSSPKAMPRSRANQSSRPISSMCRLAISRRSGCRSRAAASSRTATPPKPRGSSSSTNSWRGASGPIRIRWADACTCPTHRKTSRSQDQR
jgi:hypothetical protein